MKEQLRSLPDRGIGYGMLRYLHPDPTVQRELGVRPQIAFNYLGRFVVPAEGALSLVPGDKALGGGADPAAPATHTLALNAYSRDSDDGPVLVCTWSWPAELLPEVEVREVAQCWAEALNGMVAHHVRPDAGGLSSSDLSLVSLDQQQIDRLEAIWRSGK